MKKYIIWFILSFFIIDLQVKAEELNINNKIIEFNKIEDFDLQGFTVIKDKLFMVLINNDDSESIIKIYDLKNNKEINSTRGNSLGHANDITYNSKENKIYVLNNGDGIVYVFDGTTFDYIEKIDVKLPIRSITYLPDEDLYAVRLVTSGYLLDSNFDKVSTLPFVSGMNISNKVGRQGWAYYNRYIYYTNWSWKRLGGNGSNSIMVYNLDGDLIQKYLTDTKIGEIEDIAFYKDKMLLGFNGYENVVKFYLEDIPTIETQNNTQEEKVIEEKVAIKKENYNFYIILVIILLVIISLILRKIKRI